MMQSVSSSIEHLLPGASSSAARQPGHSMLATYARQSVQQPPLALSQPVHLAQAVQLPGALSPQVNAQAAQSNAIWTD